MTRREKDCFMLRRKTGRLRWSLYFEGVDVLCVAAHEQPLVVEQFDKVMRWSWFVSAPQQTSGRQKQNSAHNPADQNRSNTGGYTPQQQLRCDWCLCEVLGSE
eukprot:2299038-Rhodomonas_salina.1